MTLRVRLAMGIARTVLVFTVFLMLATPALAHHVEKRFDVDARPVVIVRNPSGRIEFRSSKNPEVVVVGDHDSDKVEVDAWKMGNRVEVVTRVLSRDVKPADLQASYTITVPEETEVQVHAESGSVLVGRVSGDLRFDTVTADVQLQDVAGRLVVRTVGGSVVCLRCSGRIEVNSISGSAKFLESPLESIFVQTSRGNIYFEGSFLPQGVYTFKNYRGLIDVRFSGSDSFDLSANSMYGTVENQANLKPHTHGRSKTAPTSAKSLIGTFNEGHARVTLSSFNGTIRIRKRD